MHGGIPFQIGVKPMMTSEHEMDSAPAKRNGGIMICIVNGKYAFKSDFDKKFDEMDAAIAGIFA